MKRQKNKRQKPFFFTESSEKTAFCRQWGMLRQAAPGHAACPGGGHYALADFFHNLGIKNARNNVEPA
ncbi:hypothetical protein D3C85_1787190 [compost metagenome]